MEAAIEQHLAAISGLVALLDVFDGDTDLEPSLGDDPYGRPVAALDAEGEEHDGREPGGDDEPSLGSLERTSLCTAVPAAFSQAGWGQSATEDLERECNDEGAPGDEEGPGDWSTGP
jgi:hypothetical protein